MKFKKDDTVYLKCDGFGLTSYEEATIEKISKNKIYIEGSNYPFDSDLGMRISDLPSVGLTVSLCLLKEDIAAAEAYIKDLDNEE